MNKRFSIRIPAFKQSTYKVIYKKSGGTKKISGKMVKREALTANTTATNNNNNNNNNNYNNNNNNTFANNNSLHFELWEYPYMYSCNMNTEASRDTNINTSNSSSLSSIYDDLNWPLSPVNCSELGSAVYYSTDETGSSDEFPWDSQSLADSKDPLMTDAVNCSSPVFASFTAPPKATPVTPKTDYRPQFIFLKTDPIKQEPVEIKTEPLTQFSPDFPTLTPNNYTIIPTHTKTENLPQSTQHIANQIQLSQRYSTYSKPLQHSSNQTPHVLHTSTNKNMHTTSTNLVPHKQHSLSTTPSKIVLNSTKSSTSSAPFENLPFDITSFKIPPFYEETSSPQNSSSSSSSLSSSSSNFSTSSASSTSSSSSSGVNKKKPRLHLLQFIYCLLNEEKPNQCVCWVDQNNCVFRIINPSKLTHMWGRYKANPNMSFDSLSRSLRLYYATGRLERVAGQRNQYRFINREESINFNRRNKRKQPPNTSSISSSHATSLSTSSSTSSSHIPPRFSSNNTSINPHFHRTPFNHTTNTGKTPNSSLMFGSKMCQNYQSITRRLI